MRRRTLALSAVPLLLLAACGGESDDAEPAGGGGGAEEVTDVSVGVIPILDVAPIYVGQEQGFFEECGLNLTLETAQGGAAIVPGVVSGEFQFGFSNITSLLVAAGEGLPLRGVANGVASTGDPETDFGAVVALPDSGIEDAADLAGKRVAVNTLNNIGTTTINASVEQAGGDPGSVEYVELPFPEMPAALEQGNVDAVWVVEPFFTLATDAGAEPVAYNFVDAADQLTVAMYFTSEQYAAENADAVECFSSAMAESLQYAQDNPDAAREAITSYTEIDPAIVEQLRLPDWPAEVNRESVEQLAELSVQDGLIDEVPDLDALLP
jgi:NitT/TauT family transport system substrate-binding protein